MEQEIIDALEGLIQIIGFFGTVISVCLVLIICLLWGKRKE